MKLNAIKGFCQNSLFKKIIKTMKLLTIFILAGIAQANAKGYAQEKFTFTMNSVPVKQIFKEIEKKSDFTIFYRQDQVDLNKKVSIEANNFSIDQIMNKILRGQGVTYKIQGNIVILKPAGSELNVYDNLNTAISGTVISATTKLPIPGVTVTEKFTQNGTATDNNGRFNISIKDKNAILVFHYVGYKEVEMSIGDQTEINITLEEENKVLDQVVVIGYGTQKKKDITSSISVVSSKALEDRPNTEFGYSLEGKAAGVQVIRSSGQPQSGFSIRIRGTSSITSGSEPLYIVDGVQTQSINEINPADIESFSILKDASAAAIYGSSGANGVVLITTKRGKNQKTALTFDAYNGYSKVMKHEPVLNSQQYETLMTEMGQSLDWTKYSANTDWQNELFRTANQQNYQLSVSGGNASTNFYMSGSIVKQDGVVISNTLNRENFKLNLDHKVNKFLKVGTSLSYNRWFDVDVSENSRNGSILNVILGSPIIGVWDSTRKKYTSDPFRLDLDNPVALAEGVIHNYTNQRLNGNVYVEANILPVLKFRSMFGYEQYNSVYNYYADPYKTTSGRSFNGQAELANNSNQYWISENTLNFAKAFNKHFITAVAGFIASKTTSSASDIRTHNFANPTITTVNGGSVIDGATGTTVQTSTTSFISRITYEYAEKYLLEANYRADASSVFGPQSRWGYFPSFSAGWRISKENFFRNITAINDLKLRGSWGIVGNSQIGPYAYLGTVAPSGSYVIGGNVVAGYLPVSLENPFLKWETTKQTDIGIDVATLNSRILFTADYYYKKTTGLLLNSPVPASSGYTTALKNIGDLQNEGTEFQLTSKNLVGNFKWNSDFNISFNRNKILNIAGGIIYDGPIDERGNTSIAKAGLPLGSFFGYVSKGVDPNTGNIIYQIADTTQGLQTSDQKVIGNANPKFIYGFTNDFSYKNWSLTLFIQGVQGNDILNATRIFTEGMWEPRNQSAVVLQRWTQPGQITNIPREDLTNPNGNPHDNSLISTRYVENGSYLRIKSLSLAYNLPAQFLNKLKISRIRLYATAENLLTFTKYSGFDPEVSAFGSSTNIAPGVDFGTYPQTRDVIFGLSVTF